MRRRLAVVGIATLAILLTAIPVRRTLDGLALVVRAADFHGVMRRLADLNRVRIQERTVEIPVRDGTIAARLYAPVGKARQTVLLVSGLHPAGVDEPRLIAIARTLAEASITVVTPEIPELSHFAIVPNATDRIEDAALWLSARSGLAPAGRIGLMGISFSGGLAVVAAARPSLRDRLAYVFSFGGHDDLPRVLDYFCAGTEPDAPPGRSPPPHDYGVAIVLLNVAERLVPPDQLPALRDAVLRFLWASYLDRVDKAGAEREFRALRELAPMLPEPSSTLLEEVNNRDVGRLGSRLRPFIAFYGNAPALSPERSPAPLTKVYLLHGRDDNVIPASESVHLANRLRGRVPVRLLVTDLVSHVEADHPVDAIDVLKLGRFWGNLLAE